MRPKHHRIFHLSDVHLGGDYDGIYPVEKNFEDAVRIIADKVSQKNVSEDDSDNQYEDDVLLVTGDIVDGDDTAEPEDRAKNAELYRYFWSTLCKYRLNINTRIYVMPGNHDDPVLPRFYRKILISISKYSIFSIVNKKNI